MYSAHIPRRLPGHLVCCHLKAANTRLRARLLKLVALRSRSSEPGPLFLNSRDRGLRPHTFRPKLRAFAEQAGVKRVVTPHMLRHTAATLLIESGVGIRMVQRLLGHSSIATTEIYIHVSEKHHGELLNEQMS
nr:tyrosine-type recombinase/integrase [Bradyrhizobium sp. CCBAU 53415]